jgi:hypothetical protein
MKEALKEKNRQFKEHELQRLAIKRQRLIHELENLNENYFELNDLQKFVLIADNVFRVSFYRDNKVIEIIKSFGLLKHTPKVFISNTVFFQALDRYQYEREYLYPYEIIWGFYKLYSSSVIKEKMALDFNINLLDLATKGNRQQSNLSFPEVFKNKLEEIKKLAKFLKQEIPNYKMPISDENAVNSIIHIGQYAHKNELYNLYYFLLGFNVEAKFINVHEPDFKVEFYHLLEIVLRDKTLLINYKNSQLEYGKKTDNRRFKIKCVERLILS